MKNIKAYENKEVKLFSYEEINNAIKSGTDRDVLLMLQETETLLHYQDSKKKVYKELNLKHYAELRDKLKEKLKARLIEEGYNLNNDEPNWFNTSLLSIDDTSKRVQRIEFPELLEKAFDERGRLNSFEFLIRKTSEIKQEKIDEICEKICELEPEQLKAFLYFLKDSGVNFTEIQELNSNDSEYIEIKLFNREYVLLTEQKGEELAKESLEDGDYWEMAVKDGRTEKSKEDWNEDVLNSDGWESQINSYDGSAEYLFGKWHYFRSN